MLKNYEKFVLIDQNKENDFHAEVNWAHKDVKTNESKIIRFTFPDGKTCHLSKKHLLELLFAIGTAEEQTKMVPQTLRRTKWYETMIEVQAKKDIAKGEKIVFPLKITLPTVEEEAIQEIKKESNLLIPQ